MHKRSDVIELARSTPNQLNINKMKTSLRTIFESITIKTEERGGMLG